MEYYEKDDIVMARSQRGFFEPAIVMKPLQDYTKYRVRFIGYNNQRSFRFQELKDYNEENMKIYENQIKLAPDSEGKRLKKVIELTKEAEKRFKLL